MSDFYDYLDHLSDDAILNYAYMKNMQKHDPSLFSPAVMSGRTLPSYIPSTDRQVVPDHIWDDWTKATDIWEKEAAEAANRMWLQGNDGHPYYKQVQAYKTSYLPSTTKHVIPDKEWFSTPKLPKKPVEPTLGDPKASHVGKGASMNMKPFNYTPTHLQYNKGYDSGYNDVAKQVAYDKASSAINSKDSSSIIQNYYNNFGVNKSIPTPPATTTTTTSSPASDPMSNFTDTQKSYYNYLTGYQGLGHKQALNSMGITF